MTLQARMIIVVLVATPLVWLMTIGVTYVGARDEIDELYDTDMVRMAQQMHAVLPLVDSRRLAALPPLVSTAPPDEDGGNVGLGDLAIAAWGPTGEALHIDPDGDRLPSLNGRKGFADVDIDGVPWRLYFLSNLANGWRVCVGQLRHERQELILSYVLAQVLPWIAGLPLLVGLLVWGVRRALAPMRSLSDALERRKPDDSEPLDATGIPGELRPLVAAMNNLLQRIGESLEHERRVTADAAHEMRTPLAALRAQWEVAKLSTDAAERKEAFDNVERGIERLSRLFSQLLTLSRLEDSGGKPSLRKDPVQWPVLAEQTLSDNLILADRKGVDVEVIWPPSGDPPMPMDGDASLLAVMLRNLLDNAIRYSAAGSIVTVSFEADAIEVRDQGQGVASDVLPRLGDRFFRVVGHSEPGSGLGLSIARRIAELQGIELKFANRMVQGRVVGFVATMRRRVGEKAENLHSK